MRKSAFFLAFMLLTSFGFAQSKMPFTSSKPFNKGNIFINLGYEKQPASCQRGEAPKICFSECYGFTDWCMAGIYADYGKGNSFYGVGNSYWCQYRNNYIAYGIQAKMHPITLLLPGFYFLDAYILLRAGMHHYICSFISEEGVDPFQESVSGSLKNDISPYISGGWGIAINPWKYFGIFYERTYNTLNDYYEESANSLKHHLYHRFGINVRFGGPKKWQK